MIRAKKLRQHSNFQCPRPSLPAPTPSAPEPFEGSQLCPGQALQGVFDESRGLRQAGEDMSTAPHSWPCLEPRELAAVVRTSLGRRQ